jgi:mycothiol synthase
MDDFALRAPTDADLPALVALFREAARERGIEPTTTEQDIRRRWGAPSVVVERNHRVAVAGARLVGHVGVEQQTGSDQAHSGGYVLPEYRGRGIGAALLGWAIKQARTFDGVADFRTHASAEIPASVALIEGWGGFEHIRSWFRMVNRAPAAIGAPEFPNGIELRVLEGDEFIDAFVAAYDGSFVDHFNFHPADREQIAYFVKEEPDFDPTLAPFAFDGERLAGFCMTWLIKGGATLRGDLGPIGTMRSHRGIGLGRALLRNGTRNLAARGALEVELGVDSENPNGAVRLYESNGYERTHEGRSYRLKL